MQLADERGNSDLAENKIHDDDLTRQGGEEPAEDEKTLRCEVVMRAVLRSPGTRVRRNWR
jgi:hypothetical protein